MKPSKKNFMENIRKELNSFENIPKNHEQKKVTINKSNTTRNSVNLDKQNTVSSKVFQKINFNLNLKIDPSISILQKINATNSIKEIKSLYDKLSLIQRENNLSVVKKYLIGFLEERGVGSLKEFIGNQLLRKHLLSINY